MHLPPFPFSGPRKISTWPMGRWEHLDQGPDLLPNPTTGHRLQERKARWKWAEIAVCQWQGSGPRVCYCLVSAVLDPELSLGSAVVRLLPSVRAPVGRTRHLPVSSSHSRGSRKASLPGVRAPLLSKVRCAGCCRGLRLRLPGVPAPVLGHLAAGPGSRETEAEPSPTALSWVAGLSPGTGGRAAAPTGLTPGPACHVG